MKRHASLQGLSRDHYQALVLARALAAGTPAGEDGVTRSLDVVAPEVRERFERELQPHFLLEERELVPLCLCADGELPRLGRSLLDQHAALRAGFREEPQSDGFAALGRALTAHVRFEERELFPSLEAQLSPEVLTELGFRLQTEPEVPIVGFVRDADEEDEGTWVARLACGHGQHVRHRPPFREAAWVTTEAGRAARLGSRLRCPLCRMPRIPACAEVYQRSPVYDTETLPVGLQRSHRLGAWTWARIEVLAGRVHYVLEDDADATLVLRPGLDGVAGPGRPHHVEPQDGARLRIHFCRVATA